MLRRNFLKALALAVAVPAIAIHLEPANAVVAPVVHPHQKYIDALALFDAAVAAHTTKAGREALAETANAFFTFTLDNFAMPTYSQEEKDQVREFLNDSSNSTTCVDKLRSVPPALAEVVWPVAATKVMLSIMKMPLNPKTIEGFGNFVERYKYLIIS